MKVVHEAQHLAEEQAQELHGDSGHIGLGCRQHGGVKDPLGVAGEVLLHMLAYHCCVRLLTHCLHMSTEQSGSSPAGLAGAPKPWSTEHKSRMWGLATPDMLQCTASTLDRRTLLRVMSVVPDGQQGGHCAHNKLLQGLPLPLETWKASKRAPS